MHQEEYININELEDYHWWYKCLHKKTIDAISNLTSDKNINIVDAGCGTGGLMKKLKDLGYKNIKGFDISELATNFSKEKNLDIFNADIKEIEKYFFKNSVDIIISNDTLYFFNEQEQKNIIKSFFEILKNNGIIILNLPSLNAFRGLHDKQVGITSRFNDEKINHLLQNYFSIINKHFWPFLLSPIIFSVRLFNRTLSYFNNQKVKSDLNRLSPFLNNLMLKITQVEDKIRFKPFGSSIFVVAKKTQINY